MKYQFKQAAHIKPKGKPGKTFHLGVHEVSEHFEYDPYFLKLVSAGLVVEPDARLVPAAPKSNEEKSKALLEKLVHRSRAGRKPAPEVAPVVPPKTEPKKEDKEIEPKAEEAGDFFDDDEKDKKKKKKG